jgi:hypothetical protein
MGENCFNFPTPSLGEFKVQSLLGKFTKFGMHSCIVIALLGLVFRSTLYWLFPVVDGEPYGLGDILDFGFFLLLVLVSVLTLIASLIQLIVWRSIYLKPSIKAIVTSIGSMVIYYNIHAFIPRLL